jgi:hypothetical protein
MSLYSPKKYQWNNQPTKKLDVDSRTADWYKVGEITASINSPITWEDNYDGKSFKHGTGPLVFKLKGGPPGAKIVYTFKDLDATGYIFYQSPAGTYVDWGTLDATGNYDSSLDPRFTSTGGPYTSSMFRETGTGRVLRWPHHFFIDVFVEWKGKKIKVSKDVDWYVTWPTVLNCSTQGITGNPSREDNYASELVKFTISTGEPGAPITYAYTVYDRFGSRIASSPLARLQQVQVEGQPPVQISLDTSGNLNFGTLVPSAQQHTGAGISIAQARTCNYPLKVENQIYMFTGSDAILLGSVVYYVAKPAQRIESSNSGVSWSDTDGGTTYGTVLFGPNNSSVTGTRLWKGSNTDYEVVASGVAGSTDSFGHFSFSQSFGPLAYQWLTTRPDNPLTYPITQKYVFNVGGAVYELYSTITA